MLSFRRGPWGPGWMLVAALLAVAGPAHAGPGDTPEWTAQADGLLGLKFVHAGDWAGYATHQSIGVGFSGGRRSWPALIAADVLFSAKSKTEYDSARGGDVIVETFSSFEAGLGARKVWTGRKVMVSVGGGVSYLHASLGRDTATVATLDQGHAGGLSPWIASSLAWRFGHGMHSGLAAHYSTARVPIYGRKIEAGGVHLDLVVGVSWPRS